MTPFQFVVLALATWRLSHMLSLEVGPFDVFARLRLTLGATVPLNGGREIGTTHLSRLVLCPLCLSVWIGLVLVGTLALVPSSWLLLVVLAVSGVSSIVSLWASR